MPFSPDDYVRFARDLGSDPSTVQTYLKICDLDPLPAVIQCAKDAGAITPERATQLSGAVTRDRFADLVKTDDPPVLSAADMKRVPKGAFIAFIFLDPPAANSPQYPIRKGVRHLIHVMVSLGNGRAVGTKGKNMGLPVRTTNWEEVDLSTCLLWNTVPGTYDAIAESLGVGSPRHLRIRYREIEKFQEGGTNGTTSASTQALVSRSNLQHYVNNQHWWYYSGHPDFFLPDEGWKLHVSCSLTNAAQILDLTLPILRANSFTHKFLLTRDHVAEQNADPEQQGKVMCIYPDNIAQAFAIVGVIDAALNGHVTRGDSPVIASEIAVGTTVVYTRYGAFAGPVVRNQADNDFVPDLRDQARPAWIQDPWGNYPNQAGLAALPPWPGHPRQRRRAS
jgi:hypothetical protein